MTTKGVHMTILELQILVVLQVNSLCGGTFITIWFLVMLVFHFD